MVVTCKPALSHSSDHDKRLPIVLFVARASIFRRRGSPAVCDWIPVYCTSPPACTCCSSVLVMPLGGCGATDPLVWGREHADALVPGLEAVSLGSAMRASTLPRSAESDCIFSRSCSSRSSFGPRPRFFRLSSVKGATACDMEQQSLDAEYHNPKRQYE